MSHVPATWTGKGQNSLTDSATKLNFSGSEGMPPRGSLESIYSPKARISGAGLANNTPCLQIMWCFDVWINNRDSPPTMQSLPVTWSFFFHFLGGCFHLHKGCQNCSQVSVCLLEEGNLTDSKMLRLGLSQRY